MKATKTQTKRPPPIEAIKETAAVGNAVRLVHVRHDEQVRHDSVEIGTYWDCPKCNGRRDAYGKDLVQAIQAGKPVAMQCGQCGTWVKAQAKKIELITGAKAVALARKAVQDIVRDR